MTSPIIQCAFCRHFRPDEEGGNFCDAFPDGRGIPNDIIMGRFDHSQPHEGDHGIHFEPREDLPGQPTSGLRPFTSGTGERL